ncbi:MAG: hypothetical protein RLZ25_219 [Pseudomonadota bacterium]
MMEPRIEELPYFEDSAALFLPWAERPWSVFLDSGFPHSRQGRFDLIAAEPQVTLITRGDVTEIREGDHVETSKEDPFALLARVLGPQQPGIPGLPFAGGAIGYLGYDLARRIERLPVNAQDGEAIPEMMMGIYGWAVVVDHLARKTFLVGKPDSPGLATRWPHLVQQFSQIQTLGWRMGDFEIMDDVRPNLDRSAYGKAFDRIKRYITEGDCYQVNLAVRFEAPSQGHPWMAYQHLRTFNPAPFGAYLGYPGLEILSSSPERFIKLTESRIETKPIKGTRPRLNDVIGDATQVLALRDSLKDRAENLMIVDLLRNDIGKSAIPGSVRAPKLFEIESYATVHHMVSTIEGELKPELGPLDLLRGCFPGGSITGAPKIRSMEIIEELEPHRRGVYCGSIGYIGFDGSMDSNIAIRTLIHSGDRIRFWAGGGIVADSEADSEYAECHHKAAAMLRLVEAWKPRVENINPLGY